MRHVIVTDNKALLAFARTLGADVLTDRELTEVIEVIEMSSSIYTEGADEHIQMGTDEDIEVARRLDHDFEPLNSACQKLGGPNLQTIEVPDDLSSLGMNE